MSLTGSCHCGAVAFTVDDTPAQAISCNCSLCRRRGSLLAAVGAEQFNLTTPRETLATYTFHRHAIRHAFCPTCGCAPFSEGAGPGGKAMVMVNLRCTDADLDALEIIPFDGKSL